MASLIFAASFLTINKIKTKRAEKKETKRKAYETRYNELEREHTHGQEKQIQAQQTGESRTVDSQTPTASDFQADNSPSDAVRRTSSDERRASIDSRDDPSAWVDHVLQERSKQGNTGQFL